MIAILISSGIDNESAVELSKRILHHYDNDLNKLAKATINELCNLRGISEAKAISIIAALEIGRRRDETENKAIETIVGSKEAYNIMRRHLVDLNHEEFWIILVGRSSKVLGKELISKGGLAGTIADPKIIFGHALQHFNVVEALNATPSATNDQALFNANRDQEWLLLPATTIALNGNKFEFSAIMDSHLIGDMVKYKRCHF